ncbi:MAG TPA: EamA family transporter [Ilumatobacteraceae bacterium]|nr:EamA family transporter [Ilumatobacteraceae bacterium]HRB02603.1 EamA family transporter [Ilumatobacteraceae bacterium]
MPGRQNQHTAATLGVLAAALLFGTTGTVLVNAPSDADAISVGVLRLAIGGPTLLLVALGHGRRRALAPWLRRETLLGICGVACFQLGYFLAVERTGVAVGTVVTIGSGPVFSGIIHSAMTRTPPPRRWAIGTALSIVGVAVLGLAGTATNAEPIGIALAFVAGLGWAVFATVAKHQIDDGVHSTAIMAALFTGAAMVLSPLLIWHSAAWTLQPSGIGVALYLGMATVGLAYTLYGFALRHLAAPTVITLTLLEPITAAILGAVVVHERVDVVGWAGVAVVLVGLLLTATVTT